MLSQPCCCAGTDIWCDVHCAQKRMVYDGQQHCFSVSAYDTETESYLIPVAHAGEQLRLQAKAKAR